MISVSKRVVLAIVALVTLLLIGNIVQLVASGGNGSDEIVEPSITSTTEGSPVPSVSTSTLPMADTTSTSSTIPPTSTMPSTVTPTTSPTATRTPGARLFFEPLSLAVLNTRKSSGYAYESSVVIGETEVTGSGSIDIDDERVSLSVDTGDNETEIRQSDDIIYVNARRLGSSGTTWVALDTVGQSTQFTVKSARSIVSGMTPRSLLESLSSATNIELVAQEQWGTHFRARLTNDITAFVPLIDVIDPTSGSGTSTVDVWIDAKFHVTRVVVSSTDVSITHTLSDVGSSPVIGVPTTNDTGTIDSTSGTFLFGASTPPAAAGPSPRGVSTRPSVEIEDGIIRGTLGAVSATNETLRYEFVAGSAGGKMELGVVSANGSSLDPQSFTVLPYATWLDQGSNKGSETFDVEVRETTDFAEYLMRSPLVGRLAEPVIDHLQDSSSAQRLAPLIGVAVVASVVVSTNTLAPADTPVAFTYRMPSFDGTKISVNFFPASGLTAGQTAPTVLEVAALGRPGVTNPYAVHDHQAFVPGPATLRATGNIGGPEFNVITWDPRGSYASGGTMQLVHAYYEARDVSEIITWFASNTPATLNGAGDPAFGMVGGSAGGAMQLLTGGTDPRTDAIVPAATWNSLAASLAPFEVVDTSATRALLAALDNRHIRLSPQLRQAFAGGINDGQFSEGDLARLASSGIGSVLAQTQAPILMVQSTTDRLFPLSESLDTAQSVLANPYGVPVKIIWTNGDSSDSAAMAEIRGDSVKWLQKYVSGTPIPDSVQPTFKYWDQNGQSFDSGLYPFGPGFNDPTPVEATSSGASLQFGSAASGSITLTRRIDNAKSVVGRPTVSFTYNGSGTARAVFARVIDATTGKALDPNASPIPVVLDGSTRTVSVPLRDIVFSGGTGSDLTIEITPTNSSFVQSTSGRIDITDVSVVFPIKAP